LLAYKYTYVSFLSEFARKNGYDGLGGGYNYKNALVASNVIKKDLDYFGFSVAHEKYNWVPVQILEWSGFRWDVSEGVLRVTCKRISNVSFLSEFARKNGLCRNNLAHYTCYKTYTKHHRTLAMLLYETCK
jgi:hypothetical protein